MIGNILGYLVIGLILFGIGFLRRKLRERREEKEYYAQKEKEESK